MIQTNQLHKTTSELRNTLVQVMTHPGAPWQVVAGAADLVALDVRFDEWFLRVAKPSLSEHQVEGLLGASDEVTDLVRRAWLEREASGWDAVQQAIEIGLARLHEGMQSFSRR